MVTMGTCSIISFTLFTYVVSEWDCASYSKYLRRIDKLQDRAVKFGYLHYTTLIKELIQHSDAELWADINSYSEHPLACLLPPNYKRNRVFRERGCPYILSFSVLILYF